MYASGYQKMKAVRVDKPEELMKSYKQTGDVEMRNQLVMHYLEQVNIAIYSMRSILLSNVPFSDLFNQGVLGLIECLERYDPERGEATFDTYCYTGVRGTILKYVRKQNWLPNRLWEARKNISKARIELEQKLMREATDKEVAELLGITEQKLSKILNEISVVDTVSYEELLSQTYERGVTDLRFDSEEVGEGLFAKELSGALGNAIDKLPAKEKQVIALYYYENMNLREISEVLNLTQQRVSQVRKKALEKLEEILKDFH